MAYFSIISVLSAIILYEILCYESEDLSSIIVLLQISILHVGILFGRNFNQYLYIGSLDVLSHRARIRAVLETQRISEQIGIYQDFPLFHILISEIIQITGGMVNTSGNIHLAGYMYLLSGVVYFFFPFIVYLLAKNISISENAALLCALMFAINIFAIDLGTYSIPRSIVPFFMTMLLLGITSTVSNRRIRTGLSCVICTVVIIWHTVSFVFISILFLVIGVCAKLLGKKRNVLSSNPLRFGFLIGFGGSVYWTLFSEGLLYRVVIRLFSSTPSGISFNTDVQISVSNVINYIPLSVLVLLIVVGLLFSLDQDSTPELVVVFSLMGIVMIVLSFPGPLLLLRKLATNLSFQRWREYAFVFLSISAAIGLFKIALTTIGAKRIVVMFLIFSGLSVSNGYVASDNPLVSDGGENKYFTEEEIHAFDTINSIANGNVVSDSRVAIYYRETKENRLGHPIEVDEQVLVVDTNSKMIRVPTDQSDVLVIRKDNWRDSSIKVLPSSSEDLAETLGDFIPFISEYEYSKGKYQNIEKQNKIHSSGGTVSFTTR
ncbi:hypothetical protein PN416_17850 [Halorubrum ezzemoulense]|uniref:hypothetical protein n=1 Tax=Halorubrum ezzemoulense TaxID=337243 RepID=UPI0023307189|nr:hypothetical protein [Halorubrum ezzemoulense]MDB9281719.1 hypothetical protein [Halorubrum ezzemoulense]MDB9285241.1 hypothetical protein [Halorubrum ezzemoulense]